MSALIYAWLLSTLLSQKKEQIREIKIEDRRIILNDSLRFVLEKTLRISIGDVTREIIAFCLDGKNS